MQRVPRCLHRASRPLDCVLRALQHGFWQVSDGPCCLHRAWCPMVHVPCGMRHASCVAHYGRCRMSRVIWGPHRADWMTSTVA